MTVAELIKQLKEMPQSQEVHFAYGYGDRIRTKVTVEVTRVEESEVQWSEYHQTTKLLDEDHQASDSEDAPVTVVVLR